MSLCSQLAGRLTGAVAAAGELSSVATRRQALAGAALPAQRGPRPRACCRQAATARGQLLGGKKVNKVVLAYSGGLDTSVILKWLQDTYDCEVVTFTADLGQARAARRGRGALP